MTKKDALKIVKDYYKLYGENKLADIDIWYDKELEYWMVITIEITKNHTAFKESWHISNNHLHFVQCLGVI